MKNKLIFIGIFAVLLIFLISAFQFLNRLIVENDEGIYWATFLLVNKGHKLYSEISLSQLPGFFLSDYSIFKLLGSTIFSARLGVLYWSLLGLISLVWLGYLKKNLTSSLLTIVLLVAIPTFFNQSITLQSDGVAVAFSTLSFVFMVAFSRKSNSILLILSSIFFSLAVLTKFDYSLALPFGFILLSQKKNRGKNIFLFSLTGFLIILLTLTFFGLNNVLTSVIALREKALAVTSFEPFRIVELLRNDLLLSGLMVFNFTFLIFKRKRDIYSSVIALWFLSSLFLVFSFRPLFHHHLVFLTVPAVLLSVEIISINPSLLLRTRHLIEIKFVVILLIFSIFFANNISGLNRRQKSKLLKEREIARNYILKYTDNTDSIITDEAALYGMTGRLPPPELVDLSEVQIKSRNVSEEKFRKSIAKYQPKLVVVWNGRLNSLEGLMENSANYSKIILNGKKFFIREN